MPNYSLSLWEAETWFAQQDYIVVGGGLVGLWTAYELKLTFPKAKITILERGVIPTGASTRNAGFACFGSPTEMLSDINTMGEAEMWNLVEMRYKGIEKIKKVLGDEAISFDGCGGFECFTRAKHNLPEIEEKLVWLNKGLKYITGIEDTFTWSNEKLAQQGLMGFEALIENKLEGGLHSGKLVMALSKKVQDLGVNILTGIEVKKWENSENKVIVETCSFSIKTSKLIFAVNAFNYLVTNILSCSIARGQVLVTTPIEGLKLHGTFHFDEGYYYFRNVGNRILLGGARNSDFGNEMTDSFDTTDKIQKSLETFLYQHFVNDVEFKIEYKWSGIMAFSENKKPIIKELELNVFSIVSCNGMGVALSPIIAEKFIDDFI